MQIYMNSLDELKSGTVRTKQSHPYSYDPITQFSRPASKDDAEDSVYSDRMDEWDPELCAKLKNKHFGNTGDYWDQRSPAAIESFLKDYFTAPNLILTKVIEHCNQATGYPVWQFYFVDTNRQTSTEES